MNDAPEGDSGDPLSGPLMEGEKQSATSSEIENGEQADDGVLSLADLFGDLEESSESGALEAGGMHPGDA